MKKDSYLAHSLAETIEGEPNISRPSEEDIVLVAEKRPRMKVNSSGDRVGASNEVKHFFPPPPPRPTLLLYAVVPQCYFRSCLYIYICSQNESIKEQSDDVAQVTGTCGVMESVSAEKGSSGLDEVNDNNCVSNIIIRAYPESLAPEKIECERTVSI